MHINYYLEVQGHKHGKDAKLCGYIRKVPCTHNTKRYIATENYTL
jgi:hypothetical protein